MLGLGTGLPLNEVDLTRAIRLLIFAKAGSEGEIKISSRRNQSVNTNRVVIEVEFNLDSLLTQEILNDDAISFVCTLTGKDANEEANAATDEMVNVFDLVEDVE